MKSTKKLAASIASFAAASVLLIGGTYAWYVITNTATVTMTGRTAKVENMKVGIRANEDYTQTMGIDFQDLGLTLDTEEGGLNEDAASTGSYAYWSNEAVGFTAGTLDKIILDTGYGAELKPVTTGAYNDSTGEIILKEGLGENFQHEYQYDPVDPSAYQSYSLLFKTDPYNVINLYERFTSFSSTEPGVLNALRIGLESDEFSGIYSPSATVTPAIDPDPEKDYVETVVAGRMDKNGDFVFDYFVDKLSGKTYEIFYGDFTAVAPDTDVFNGVLYQSAPAVEGEGVALKVATGAIGDPLNDDFLSDNIKTLVGVIPVDIAGMADTELTQKAYAMQHFLQDGQAVAVADATGIAELKVTIWVEGWDRACVNAISEKDFSAQLGFISTAVATVNP